MAQILTVKKLEKFGLVQKLFITEEYYYRTLAFLTASY